MYDVGPIVSLPLGCAQSGSDGAKTFTPSLLAKCCEKIEAPMLQEINLMGPDLYPELCLINVDSLL